MRNSTTTALIALFALISIAAFAQETPVGKVSGVKIDGTITIDGGLNVGFESGDVLVIQRNGSKIALAHVSLVGPSSSTARVVKTEPGRAIKVGDVGAYQILGEINAAQRALAPQMRQIIYPEYGAPSGVPDVMRNDWKVPETRTVNYDDVINSQKDILERNPGSYAATLKLADAYFKKAWYDHSIQWNQRAIEQKPESPDNDKLIYQIIRAYGLLNQGEKQSLYKNYLKKNYPDSIFISMCEGKQAAMPLYSTQTSGMTIVDDQGFHKGGMKILQKGGMNKIVGASDNFVGDKLIHGRPIRLSPQTYEP